MTHGRRNGPAGPTIDHDHSGAGKGGSSLNPSSIDVTFTDVEEMTFEASGLVDIFQTGVGPQNETVPQTQVAGRDLTNLGAPEHVFVRGDYLYSTSSPDDSFVTISVQDPTNPVEKANLTDGTDLATAEGLSVRGDHAFVCASGNDQLTSVDISDPESPSVNDTLTGSGILKIPRNIFIRGTKAYVAGNGGSIDVVDISDPSSMSHLGNYDEGSNFGEAGVFVRGDTLYLTFLQNDTLDLFDVSTDTPSRVGSVDLGDTSNPDRVFVRGDYAFVTTGGPVNEFKSVDVTDRTSPTEADSVSSNIDSPRGIFVAGDYAYVASSGNDQIVLVDVSDPTSMSERGTYSNAPQGAEACFVANSYLFSVGAGTPVLTVHGNGGALDTGTVTATGGSSPAVDTTITNVNLEETQAHDLVVYPDSAHNFDYAFNYDWGFQWDESDSGVDINLTVNWDTDPGNNNDVTLRWELVSP